jgi:hypothetical protein
VRFVFAVVLAAAASATNSTSTSHCGNDYKGSGSSRLTLSSVASHTFAITTNNLNNTVALVQYVLYHECDLRSNSQS